MNSSTNQDPLSFLLEKFPEFMKNVDERFKKIEDELEELRGSPAKVEALANSERGAESAEA